MMSIQPLLPFEDVPMTCPMPATYHANAICLAARKSRRRHRLKIDLNKLFLRATRDFQTTRLTEFPSSNKLIKLIFYRRKV